MFRNIFLGTKKLGRTAPECPRGYGLGYESSKLNGEHQPFFAFRKGLLSLSFERDCFIQNIFRC